MAKKRTKIHDTKITIRVNEEIKRRAAEKARREGMSLSEAIRHLLREMAKDP